VRHAYHVSAVEVHCFQITISSFFVLGTSGSQDGISDATSFMARAEVTKIY